jgi:hypothetical protein
MMFMPRCHKLMPRHAYLNYSIMRTVVKDKTPYTLVQAETCWWLGWEFKTYKRKKSLRLMCYKFKWVFKNITFYVYLYTTTILLHGIWSRLSCCF